MSEKKPHLYDSVTLDGLLATMKDAGKDVYNLGAGVATDLPGMAADFISMPLAAYVSGFSMGNGQYPGRVMGALPTGQEDLGQRMGADVDSNAFLLGSIGAPDPSDLATLPVLAGIFGGRMARKAPHAAMDMAEELAQKGANRDEIWNAVYESHGVGVFRGVDGKWRYEIPDNTKIMPEYESGMASEVIDHPELAAAYPDFMENTTVHASPTDVGRLGGSYRPPIGRLPGQLNVNVPADWSDATRSYVAGHELQHGLQEVEGFATGGSPTEFMPPSGYASWREVPPDAIPLSSLSEMERVARRSRDDPETLYRKLAGEVESRNVENRLKFTPEQRRNAPPWETQSIPDEEQIVRYWGGVADSREGDRVVKPVYRVRKDALAGDERYLDQKAGAISRNHTAGEWKSISGLRKAIVKAKNTRSTDGLVIEWWDGNQIQVRPIDTFFKEEAEGLYKQGVKNNVAKSISELPMDDASRMQRAKDGGFNMDKRYYHGSKQVFDEFKPIHEDGMTFVSTNPDFAADWIKGQGGLRTRKGYPSGVPFVEESVKAHKAARDEGLYQQGIDDILERNDFTTDAAKYHEAHNAEKYRISREADTVDSSIYPVVTSATNSFDPRKDWEAIEPFLRKMDAENPEREIGALLEKGVHKEGNWVLYEDNQIVDELKRQGYDSMWLKESSLDGAPHETLGIFDPKKIRNPNAKFDPKDIDSADLMSSVNNLIATRGLV